MPGFQDKRGRLRGVVAACLTLLFWFSGLAPLLVQSLSAQLPASATAGMSCCRKKSGSCCPTHQRRGSNSLGNNNRGTNNGPAVSGRSCAGDCSHVTLGNPAGYARLQGWDWALGIAAAGVEPVPEFFFESAFSSYSLQQRPPPPASNPLA